MLQIYLKVINEIHLAVILGLSCFLCYPQEKAPDSAPVPTAAPLCHHEVAWCSPSPSRPSNRYRPGISQHSGKTNHSLGPQTSQDTKPCSSSDHGTLMLRVMEDRQEEGRVCDPQEYSRESSISTAARGNFFFFFENTTYFIHQHTFAWDFQCLLALAFHLPWSHLQSWGILFLKFFYEFPGFFLSLNPQHMVVGWVLSAPGVSFWEHI